MRIKIVLTMGQKYISETSRLLLRPFIAEDAEALYLLNADPVVLQYTGDVPFDDVNEAADFIAQYDHYNHFGYGRWAVLDRYTKHFLGWCGLKYSNEKDETDVGFRFYRQYWGLGFATESADACLDYGFNSLKLTVIVGRARMENVASHRVLQKIGMLSVGSFIEGGSEWRKFAKKSDSA